MDKFNEEISSTEILESFQSSLLKNHEVGNIGIFV